MQHSYCHSLSAAIGFRILLKTTVLQDLPEIGSLSGIGGICNVIGRSAPPFPRT
jgi:hypothetical protein